MHVSNRSRLPCVKSAGKQKAAREKHGASRMPCFNSSHEGLYKSACQSEGILDIFTAGFNMQSQSSEVCGERDISLGSSYYADLSEHELAQEKLYLIWRGNYLTTVELVEIWANSLLRLHSEGYCTYFDWLVQNHPRLI